MFRIPDTALLMNARRAGAVAAGLALAALVAGCGGGNKVKPFQPTQVIAFGDENSAIDDSYSATPLVTSNGATIKGARYTVNLITNVHFYCDSDPGTVSAAGCDGHVVLPPTNTVFVPASAVFTNHLTDALQLVNERETGVWTGGSTPIFRATDRFYDCSPALGGYVGNWAQTVAAAFGMHLSIGGSAGCPQDAGNGKSYAKWGAKIDDVDAQVNLHLGELHEGVLVTILAGQNDIMAAYDDVVNHGANQAAALQLMSNKGAQLARTINRIITTGARVAYLTVPNMGFSPIAVADGKSTVASDLTFAFNEGYQNSGGLVLSVAFKGHQIVKVDAYTAINNIAPIYPSLPACETDYTKVKMPDGTLITTAVPAVTTDLVLRAKAVLLNCRHDDLKVITAGTSTTDPVLADFGSYLWADDRHLGPVGHYGMATLAIARIHDQL